MSTDLEERTDVFRTDSGDHDRLAHIVYPKSAIMEAMVTGKPCTALCGKVWTPTKAPERFPVCPDCKRVFEEARGRPFPG